jgi:hypothetical protein
MRRCQTLPPHVRKTDAILSESFLATEHHTHQDRFSAELARFQNGGKECFLVVDLGCQNRG